MVKSQIEISPELYKYIVDNTLKEPKELSVISNEQTSIDDIILQITPHQGQFLAWLIKLIRPQRTLDIGTYKGYSSLCIALASPPTCITISIDKNEDLAKIAKEYWKQAGCEDKIDFILGEAINVLEDLIKSGNRETFDFIFIDADKANYIEYYERSIQLLKKGGIIAIDNTLYFGTVIGRKIKDQDIKRWVFLKGIKAIKVLNKLIKDDYRVESCLLPIADGLTLVRKI